MTRSAREKLSCGARRSSICFHTCTALIFLSFIVLSPERRKANPFLCSGGSLDPSLRVGSLQQKKGQRLNTEITVRRAQRTERITLAPEALHNISPARKRWE